MSVSMIKEDLRKLVIQQPFFASILLQQKLKVTCSVQTAAVDGVNLFVNPDWYCDLNPFERITILAHEVLHLTNKHNVRRKDREKRLWNIATDMAINKHLVEPPFQLPVDDKHKGQYDQTNRFGDGADAESIYSVLFKEANEEKEKIEKEKEESDDSQPEDDAQDSGDQEPDDDGAEEPDDDGESEPNDDGESEPNDDGDQGSEESDSNKSAMDQAIDNIRDKYNVPDTGDVLDHPELGETGEERLENDMNLKTHKAMNIAKKRGNMPGSIEEEIMQSCEAKVSWQDVLSEWVEGRCNSDYSWLHPHDVHLQDDIILPSMTSEAYGEIAIAIDTSGSMSNDELRVAVSEVFKALEAYHDNGQDDIKIQLIYCDTIIHGVEEISSPSQVTKPVGRGGTEFSPVFNYIKRSCNPPIGLVFITDGYADVRSYDKPQCDVLWLLTCMSVKEFNPCFGRCIKIEVE